MLVRVFEIPDGSGNYHFGGGEMQSFVEVDWFRDDSLDCTQENQVAYTKFIRNKGYFNPQKAYLVLCPRYSFTINYRAP